MFFKWLRVTSVCLFAGTVATGLVARSTVIAQEQSGSDPMLVFEHRIMPIFRSSKPSSCVQCHLSAVDLKNYILPSASDTFVALREQGLIDIDRPQQSKILKLIDMGEKDADDLSRRIHEKLRRAEYDAFAAWIVACCNDPNFRDLPVPQNLQSVGPDRPMAVVRHARKSRLVESFTRNVWSQRMRCFPCHTPHELDPDNPKHVAPIETQHKFVKKYGAKINLFAQTPEATLARWIAASRKQSGPHLPLIHLRQPENSLLLLKPTAKLPAKRDDGTFEPPSSVEPVSHMGGLKMHPHDQSYKAIVTWITDYAATLENQYVSVDDLPADNWVPTQRILRIRDVPNSWGQSSVAQLFVYPRSADGDAWSDQPIAFTQGTITPRRFVNGPLTYFRSHTEAAGDQGGSDQAGSDPLPPGKYLIRVCVDRDGAIAEDPTAMLGPQTLVGEIEIDAKWLVGFPNAEVVSAAQMN